MDAPLQEYYDSDPGFAQFVERHGVVAAMPDIRKAYRRWEYDVILDMLEEERRNAKMEALLAESKAEGEAIGEARGEARGEAKGRDERDMEIAQKAFAGLKHGRDLSEIVYMLKEFDIPDDIIDSAKKQAEAGFHSAV